ncbi:hypothetical protein BCR35DRAFT_301466 [Leucosporidium creatinivorum]|uniref:ABM domain-containing protein n=1 Tax=Leucosporidium creatinivorum TaxID=106004 RepID=A0A1Y2FZN2_9BASI|nr:hypothetical protein BCR35DRAFT_301466 [Leucosporidium creatinivorum]
MAPITLMPHEDIKGKFMIVAKVTAVAGREEELETLLKAVVKESNDELSCLTYRAARGPGDQSKIFTVIEEYVSRDALTLHRAGKAYLALRNSGTVEKTDVNFFEELQ